jgi:hypothetical protein
VVRKLKKCRSGSGCCSTGDCDFDPICPDTLEAVNIRLTEYVARLKEEKDCFDVLKGEPAALTQRVADIKTTIDNAWKPSGSTATPGAGAAGDDTTTEESPVDLHRVYATLLVAQRRLQTVWNGFGCTQDFLDCLCRALTCWIKATEAVSVLTGHQAVLLCQVREAKARCDTLATETEDEVLLEYERLCGEVSECPPDDDEGEEPCEPEEPDEGECEDEPAPSDDDDSDDCGCGNEHHHKKGSKKKGSDKKGSKKR